MINMAIIGFGKIGEVHAKWINNNKDLNLVAVSKKVKERVEEIKNKFNVEVYLDNKKIMARKDIDFVVIATTNESHEKLTIEALRNNKNVIVEKPMSINYKSTLRMIDAAVKYKKKFLVIGSMSAITYKDMFSLIKDNKIWLGQTQPKEFMMPPNYDTDGASSWKDESGVNWRKFGNICWYTNLSHKKRNEELTLYRKYNPKDYPKYDNYDAINVDKTKEIPIDWDGVMGVPITFLDKYNPNQFEILGIANSARWIGYECLTIIGGRKLYNRILIRRKK